MEEQTIQQPLQEQSKSKAWIWIIVILVLLGLGYLAYIMLSGDSSSSGGLSSLIPGGNSIPQPPALPE